MGFPIECSKVNMVIASHSKSAKFSGEWLVEIGSGLETQRFQSQGFSLTVSEKISGRLFSRLRRGDALLFVHAKSR